MKTPKGKVRISAIKKVHETRSTKRLSRGYMSYGSAKMYAKGRVFSTDDNIHTKINKRSRWIYIKEETKQMKGKEKFNINKVKRGAVLLGEAANAKYGEYIPQ